MTDEQKELLTIISEDHHAVFGQKFVDRCTKAFDVRFKTRIYTDLREYYGPPAPSLGAAEIVEGICHHYGIKFEYKHGRGSQVWECVHKLRARIDAGCTDLTQLYKDIQIEKKKKANEKRRKRRQELKRQRSEPHDDSGLLNLSFASK